MGQAETEHNFGLPAWPGNFDIGRASASAFMLKETGSLGIRMLGRQA
jgi:hypothetical protein